jgi:hypothetical protein
MLAATCIYSHHLRPGDLRVPLLLDHQVHAYSFEVDLAENETPHSFSFILPSLKVF